MRRALVTGAGGFIGHYMVKFLRDRDYWVRGVDVKDPEYEPTSANEFLKLDLRYLPEVEAAFRGPDFDEVYCFAAWMGGISFITSHFADLTRNNVFINTLCLEVARTVGVGKLFYASSACAYSLLKQDDPNVAPLKEEDAWPAQPERGYGFEKLFTEQMAEFFHQDYGLNVRVARFHNVMGPLGAFEGGREKAPAAISRKIASAKDGDEIEVWGDGKQTRSFIYIDDCVEGVYRLVQLPNDYTYQARRVRPYGNCTDVCEGCQSEEDCLTDGPVWHPYNPINIGSDRMVSVDELVDLIAWVAGKQIGKKHDLTKPQGVRGRNSDNTLMRAVLDWEPKVSLEEGLEKTYAWIYERLKATGKLGGAGGASPR